MSSLQDPFDLITPDNDMENVIPFLPQAKIDHMIEAALRHQQLPAPAMPTIFSNKVWWSGGLATAACVLLLLFVSPIQVQNLSKGGIYASITNTQADDLGDVNEMVMLDTLDTY